MLRQAQHDNRGSTSPSPSRASRFATQARHGRVSKTRLPTKSTKVTKHGGGLGLRLAGRVGANRGNGPRGRGLPNEPNFNQPGVENNPGQSQKRTQFPWMNSVRTTTWYTDTYGFMRP